MKKPKHEQTREIDSIRCIWCGHLFDGGPATNYDSSVDHEVDCPQCGGKMWVMQSVEYTAIPYDEDGAV